MLTFPRMAFLGTIVFAVFFLLIAPKSRAMLGGVLDGAGDWVTKWAPVSYFLIAVGVLVPALAALVVVKWPQAPEPENPLARYKSAQDVIED